MKPFIPNSEFEDRIQKTQQEMKKEGLDLLLCYGNEAEPQYVRYYSNYSPLFESSSVLIPVEGEPYLLIGPEGETFASEFSRIKNIRKILYLRESSEPEYPNATLDTFEQIFKEISNNREISKFGIAGYGLIPQVVYRELRNSLDTLGGVEIVKSDSLVTKLRMIKSNNEIACLQEAYNIAEYALKSVLETIHIGMTENEVKGIALRAIYEKGAESEGYPFWILTGEGSNKAIGKCRNKVIQKGDIIQVQLSARYEGYVSTLGRAIVAGKPTEEQEALINAGLEVEKAILSAAKPGVNARAINEIHYSTLDKLGFADHILYGPVHGTGLMENEHPWIESSSDYILEPGMTFCTCLYLGDDKNKVGIRIEDGFLITKEGAKLFSDYERRVIQI
jgi:Xaa-Pro aminopeptidase